MLMAMLKVATNSKLSSNQVKQVSKLLGDNGWSNVTLVADSGHNNHQFMVEMSKRGTFSNTVVLEEFEMVDKSDPSYFVILLNNHNMLDDNLLNHISNTVPRSVMVILTSELEQEELTFSDRLSINLHFLVTIFSRGGDNFKVHQVINTPRFHLPVVNQVRLASDDEYLILEEYDLQGRNLLGGTLPFPPYMIMEGCDDQEPFNGIKVDAFKCSTVDGLQYDAFASLSRRYNFTFEIRYFIIKVYTVDIRSYGLNSPFPF